MLLLAAASALMVHPAPAMHPGPNPHSAEQRPGSLIAEATATVRILSGVRITAASQPPEAQVETVKLPAADGRFEVSRLIQFQ